MKIYVGNLSYDTSDEDLRTAFSAYGEVASAQVVSDRYTGRSRGFGFVEMPNKAQADAAIAALNGKALNNRTLSISEARPRAESGQDSRGRFGSSDRSGQRGPRPR